MPDTINDATQTIVNDTPGENIDVAAKMDISPGLQQHDKLNNKMQPNISEQLNEWFIADGVPGTGEKPEWFNDKTFKTIMEQAKAQPEARKALGAHTGAPEEYEINLGEDYKNIKIDQENPEIKSFIELAKKNKISQEFFTESLKKFVDVTARKDASDWDAYIKSELDKIGPDAQQKLEDLSGWLTQNFGEDAAKKARNWISSKEQFDFLMSLRNKMGYAKAPASQPENIDTLRELARKRMTDPRAGVDANFDVKTMEIYKKINELA